MTSDRMLVLFMGVVGTVIGLLLVAKPELRDVRISPYFWVLIAMAMFELAAHARGGGAVSMPARLIAFVLAIALMILIPVAASSPGRLF
jgi:hypothetical protein